MSSIKAIRNDADYREALARIDALMEADAGTPEGDELDVLTDLVEHYEEKSVPMGFPTAIAAIERLLAKGLTVVLAGRTARRWSGRVAPWLNRSSAAR